jgi:FkbM family methyltransferase
LKPAPVEFFFLLKTDRTMMRFLKSALKKIPGARWMVKKLRASAAAQHSEWLYVHEVVGWLYRPELRRQVPFLFRLFGLYARAQRACWDGPIIGGERFLNTVMRISRFLGRPDSTLLDLGEYKVFLDLQDPLMLTVPNQLLKDRPEKKLLNWFLTEGDTFLDVGANHGCFSILASKKIGEKGAIIAVEPQPKMARLARKSLQLNAKSGFNVLEFACGEEDGEIEFFVPNWSSGSAGVFADFSGTTPHRKFKVARKRFEDSVDWKSFRGKVLLKIDVEGSELFFLRGAGQMLRTLRPHILFEINPKSAHAAGLTVEASLEHLRHLGYTQYAEMIFPLQFNPFQMIDTTQERNILVVP